MNKKKFILGFILFALGLIGVLSMLTMELPLPPEIEAILKEEFSPRQIKLLLLINPTLLLIVTVIIGTILYDKVNLKVPIIEKWIGIDSGESRLNEIIKYGITGGVISGILISLVAFIFYPILPDEFIELGEKFKPTLAARFLYAGITEEILVRFGFMTFIVWICSKVTRGTKPKIYWIGIFIATIIFALGHFPVAYSVVENPSSLLLTYILIGNSIGGIIFGWLYWKKGLESAFIAHIFAHVIMVLAEPIINS